MNSSELNREQLDSIKQHLGPTLAYLNRLRTRMEQTGFVPSDKLYESVVKTAADLQELTMRLHYLGCDGVGNGRTSPIGEKPTKPK